MYVLCRRVRAFFHTPHMCVEPCVCVVPCVCCVGACVCALKSWCVCFTLRVDITKFVCVCFAECLCECCVSLLCMEFGSILCNIKREVNPSSEPPHCDLFPGETGYDIRAHRGRDMIWWFGCSGGGGQNPSRSWSPLLGLNNLSIYPALVRQNTSERQNRLCLVFEHLSILWSVGTSFVNVPLWSTLGSRSLRNIEVIYFRVTSTWQRDTERGCYC